MVKHDQGLEDPKRRGHDNEHVDRHCVSQVVVQKATPSRGRGLGAPRQIPPDCGLADIHAELEQFAVDARRAPTTGWQSSSGRSGRGFRHSSWVVQYGVIAIASGCEGPCDTIRSRSPVDEYQGIEELRSHLVSHTQNKRSVKTSRRRQGRCRLRTIT
jgi:hypothetical protein